MKKPITVFISYTWDNETHKEWVLKLANYLIEKGGLNVILDQYDLTTGKDMNHFMENGLEIADKVLIILTEKYKQKADKRVGGTGFEYSMISQGLFELQADNNKFIPVLRSGDLHTSAPTYLKTKIYHPMKDDNDYEIALFELIRIIYEKPKLVKPERGQIPDFDSPDIDPIIAIASDLSSKDKINRELNFILASTEGVELAKNEARNLFNKIEQKAFDYSDKTDFKFNVQKDTYERSLIVSSNGHSVSLTWSSSYSNSTKDAVLRVTTWLGHLAINRYDSYYFPGKEPKNVSKTDYSVDLDEKKKIIWRKGAELTDTTEDIVQMVFVYLIQAIQKDKEKHFRK